ncbi:MAG: hypothetical protein QM490_01480 [Candidatus Gracilibacteria bacterium]
MNTSKKTVAAILVTGLLATLTLSGVSAYKGDPSVQGPDSTTERHEAMTEAFTTSNYDAWATLMEGKGRVKDVVTADNFDVFVEAHNLAATGDLEGAKALRAELGLGLQDGSNKGNGKGMNKGTRCGNGGGRGMNR